MTRCPLSSEHYSNRYCSTQQVPNIVSKITQALYLSPIESKKREFGAKQVSFFLDKKQSAKRLVHDDVPLGFMAK
ncbi:hypothetical protein GAYE_SCF53G6115 [Galdieria yellowstonensis]|uniref:Uncharacterized protein n=1 Tax=Galdieria yellowstonensis TaxID=3028027 RepID=A0AAV9ILA1_9RHOD|nr:hypothetical protein GAYE_SCF53G6115 [Galdieria yellowstonensis]